MKSLYGLCEYGISLNTVRYLESRNISAEMLLLDSENVLSEIWNKESKKKNEIIDIIKKDSNVFGINSVYELNKYGLSLALIEKIRKLGLTMNELNNIGKSQLINKYHFGNVVSDKILIAVINYKQNINNEKNYDYSEYLLNYIKSKTEMSYISIERLKEKLSLETNYPIEFFYSDIEKLKNQGKIDKRLQEVRYNFPKLSEKINMLDNAQKYSIIKERLSGATLETIGKKHNITRERVRQIVEKIYKKIGDVYENIYVEDFLNYDFSLDEFEIIFNESKEVYNFLKDKTKNNRLNKKDIFEYLKYNDIPELKEKEIYQKYNTIIFDGERIILNKNNIINVYLKNLKESKTMDEISNELNLIFEKYGLERYGNRALEALLDRDNNCIGSIKRKYRYFDFENIDNKIIDKIKNMFKIENGYYSTLMIFNNYKDFFEEIDIQDEYELHNLIRKFPIEIDNVKLERMPNFKVGNINKRDFFYNEILEYAPININDFLKIMEEEYGHKELSLKNYISKNYPYNINGLNLITNYVRLSDKEINLIKSELNDILYHKNEFLKIMERKLKKDCKKYINTYNIKKLGYKIINNYIIQENQKSIDECLKNKILSKDFYELEDKYATSTYYFVLNNLETNLDIVKFNNDLYITIKKMNEVGITKEDLINYRNFINKILKENEYFTIKYLEKKHYPNKLEKYGFEDDFYESIIGKMDRIKKIRFSGVKVFCKRNSRFTKIDFITDLINNIGIIDIYKLKNFLYSDYGIIVSKENLQEIIYESDLYYSKILEKVFRNKEEYYREVYK